MYEPSIAESAHVRLDALRATRASPAAVETRRRRRLDALLRFVLRQSRFYRRHYAAVERPITRLDALPPVTKPLLMENFDDVVTDTAVTRAAVEGFVADESTVGERFLDRYPVWRTSGTTGEPGTFLRDGYSATANDAAGDRWALPAFLDFGALWRVVANGGRVAEIAVTGGHYAAASFVARFRREHPLLRDRMRLFSPTEPLSELVARLNAYRPAVLAGYATVLRELAREQRAGRLALSPAFVQPAGEPITSAEKRELRRAFGCAVRESYGASEFGALALECGRGNLHANTDWFVIEPVDAAYDPVEPGTPSETVLVTDLAKRVQPLVRYDLGDSVTVHEERCPCGSPFPVVEVGGRQGDVLRFEAEDGDAVPVFPLAVSSVVEAVSGVYRAQLVRTGARTLTVRLDVTDDAAEDRVWERVERDLTAFLRARGITDVRVERAAAAPARDPDSGKFRHVWSAV